MSRRHPVYLQSETRKMKNSDLTTLEIERGTIKADTVIGGIARQGVDALSGSSWYG